MTEHRRVSRLEPLTAVARAVYPNVTRFSDGQEPLIGRVGAVILIADEFGVTLNWGAGRSASVDVPNDYGPVDLDPQEIRAFARELFAALAEEF